MGKKLRQISNRCPICYVDMNDYPFQVHIVHYNTKYKTLSAAKQQPDGLAVIGIFADVGFRNFIFFSDIKFEEIPFKLDPDPR